MGKEILVLLKNNYKYKGELIEEDDTTIVLNDRYDGKIRIKKSEIIVRSEGE